jgi:hypothetical protein
MASWWLSGDFVISSLLSGDFVISSLLIGLLLHPLEMEPSSVDNDLCEGLRTICCTSAASVVASGDASSSSKASNAFRQTS